MADRDPEEERLHQEIIEKVVRVRRHGGWHVKADLEGEEDPPEVNGERPDVYATKDPEMMVVEVETPSTISLEETRREYEAFQRYCRPTPEEPDVKEFRVYTPKSSYKAAMEQVEEWGILDFHTTQYFWYFEEI